MSNSKKIEVPATSSTAEVVAVPTASVNDTAAFIRESPVLVDVLTIEVPSKVRAKGAVFAQQDLRKLDADLGPEADRALAQLQQIGPARLAADLGPAVAMVRGLDELVVRRTQSTAVINRIRALIDYAETQRRVFDHDAVLMLEAIGDAVGYLGQFDDAMRDRYGATLDVLNARTAKITQGLARARAATPVPATPVPAKT